VNGALKTEKEERERELGARVWGKENCISSAPVTHLNAISRLSEMSVIGKLKKISRRRDCVAQNTPGAGHSRPGEPLLA